MHYGLQSQITALMVKYGGDDTMAEFVIGFLLGMIFVLLIFMFALWERR